MATSQNGWPALPADSNKLVTWVIPAKTGVAKIRARNGSAGFVIAHFLLWFAEVIQPLAGKILDDWGWAWRPVRGQTSGLSNHASGTAVDMNATQHPLGKRGTFLFRPLRWTVGVLGRRKAAPTALELVHRRLRVYDGVLRWGADYQGRVDEMHIEIDRPLAQTEKLARRLMRTPRGRRLLKANPGQRKVILS